MKYHAVMLDETGCEFGVSLEAEDKGAAHEQLREDYPESSIVQLEDTQDTMKREKRLRMRIEYELGGE